ncbi:MAG: phosphomannomutase/phosphoglucomutase [Gammaproteobacteria bacterium]
MPETSIDALPKSIFRAYDIRGVVGETLNSEIMQSIGQAIGSEARSLGNTKIAVGRDGRLSGPQLSKALIEGLLMSGIDVIDLGRVPTPVLYFATHVLEGVSSGVMLTGSHNPVNHNGAKIVLNHQALAGEQIEKLYQRILNLDFTTGEGHLTKLDIISEYIATIKKDVTVKRPLKVVVDSGNGIAGLVAPTLLRELGCDVYELHCEVDGHFPNHHPDPSQMENLQDLIQMVCQKKADIGLAFDGDGDRLGVVTSKGDVIWPDRQLILYALDILKRTPGATIIYDVKSTRHLATQIEANGGKPLMYCTGHSLVKGKIRETGALLGGEMSGHMFFNDRWYGFDDALYTAARLLEILSHDERDPDAVFAEIPEDVSTPELRIHMHDDAKFDFMKKLVESSRFDGDAQINTIDGLRVDFPDGWGLVRASNTTPFLVVRFEADDEKALQRIQNQFRQCLLSLDADLKLPF